MPGSPYSTSSAATLQRISVVVSGAAFRFRKLPLEPRGAEYIELSSTGVYPPRHDASTASQRLPHLTRHVAAVSIAGRLAARAGSQDAEKVVRLGRPHDGGVMQ